ncbi:MAG: glycosyltransferase family 9 protein [Candidatus Omnitrophica bacterium]|nr:glycosyltransferase family 9 protein [Candidatus Omnitrophota bacterium]
MAIKKILAIRNDRFGEFLLNIPAFKALKNSFKDCRLTLAVNPYVKELAEKISFADKVITFEPRKHTFKEIIDLSNKLRREDYDLSVVFNPSKDSHLVSFLSAIPRRVGYSRKWGFLLNYKISDLKSKALTHEVEYNLRLAALSGARIEDRKISLEIEDHPAQEIFALHDVSLSDSLIAVHPFTSDPIKQWPFVNFQKLISFLSREHAGKILIIGGKNEKTISERFFSSIGSNVVDLTGKTDLPQLASVLKKCQVLISCDSGPMHLAAAVGIKVIALFRSDIEAKSSRRWGPWGIGHTVIEKKEITDISVDEVLIFSRAYLLK